MPDFVPHALDPREPTPKSRTFGFFWNRLPT